MNAAVLMFCLAFCQ